MLQGQILSAPTTYNLRCRYNCNNIQHRRGPCLNKPHHKHLIYKKVKWIGLLSLAKINLCTLTFTKLSHKTSLTNSFYLVVFFSHQYLRSFKVYPNRTYLEVSRFIFKKLNWLHVITTNLPLYLQQPRN